MSNVEYKLPSAPIKTQVDAEEPMEHKLTSILAADMVGYSRWMASDEEGVIRRLRWARAEIIDPSLTRFGGRIVRIMGDGLLVEFASPVAAVRSAIAIQLALAKLDAVDLNQRSLLFRIGLNVGDVVVDDEDLLGDCVNIAARLESMAPVGGICLSRAVHDQVRGQIYVPMTPLGAQRLKNMPKPVEVWKIESDSMVATASSCINSVTSLGAQEKQPSATTIPFKMLPGFPD